MTEPTTTDAPTMLTVSGVCTCDRCERFGERCIYRMVGKCWNCQIEPILMLFRVGEEKRPLQCPLCGCRDVRAFRRATDDEIPAPAPEN